MARSNSFTREGYRGPVCGNIRTVASYSDVEIEARGGVALPGALVVPAEARGVVVFAHGSGSSRKSPRNVQVASVLNESRMGTLLFDLLTPEESTHRSMVFDIPLLAERLISATRWMQREVAGLPLGYFGASTGAGAALLAAAELREAVGAVVSRGGRPDLAGDGLGLVTAPTLLIVGGEDPEVLELNRQAQATMRCPNALEVVPGAGHMFEEPGALEQVQELAAGWFQRYLGGDRPVR
jgi:putative phosphoribosyl transferase